MGDFSGNVLIFIARVSRTPIELTVMGVKYATDKALHNVAKLKMTRSENGGNLTVMHKLS